MRWFEGSSARPTAWRPSAGPPRARLRDVVNPAGDDALAEQLYQRSLASTSGGRPGRRAGTMVRLGHSAWYRGDSEGARSSAARAWPGAGGRATGATEAQALGLLGELEFERGA